MEFIRFLLIITQAAEFLDIPDLYQFLVNEIGKSQFDDDGIAGDVENVEATAQERKRPVRKSIIIILIIIIISYPITFFSS